MTTWDIILFTLKFAGATLLLTIFSILILSGIGHFTDPGATE